MESAPDTQRQRRRASIQPLEVATIPDSLLTLRTASAVAGLSIATIYRKAASDPTFPGLIRLSARCTRVKAGPFMAWLARHAA